MKKAICGICGTTESDDKHGFCKEGHDHWVEEDDFLQPGLATYLVLACKHLDCTMDELKEKVKNS